MDTQHVIDSANTVTKIGGVGAGSSPVLYWLVDNSELISLFLGIAGFTLALAGFVVAWVYNHKRYKLQEKQFEIQNNERD